MLSNAAKRQSFVAVVTAPPGVVVSGVRVGTGEGVVGGVVVIREVVGGSGVVVGGGVSTSVVGGSVGTGLEHLNRNTNPVS